MNAYQIHVRATENAPMASTIISATVLQDIMARTVTEVPYIMSIYHEFFSLKQAHQL